MDREERWFAMPIGMQLANIGGEVSRAIRWKKKNDRAKMIEFYNKAVELIRLTEKDPKNKNRIGELQACEEELADYIIGENVYGTMPETLTNFYDSFI